MLSSDQLGWIFTPTGVSAGLNLTPTEVSNFHKNDPKRVAKHENFTSITPKERLRLIKMIPNRSMFDIWIPNQRVCLRWKRGVQRATHPYWLWKQCPPPPPPPPPPPDRDITQHFFFQIYMAWFWYESVFFRTESMMVDTQYAFFIMPQAGKTEASLHDDVI